MREDEIRQLADRLGSYLYDCAVDYEQVRVIADIVHSIRQLSYEQGIEDMQGVFRILLGL